MRMGFCEREDFVEDEGQGPCGQDLVMGKDSVRSSSICSQPSAGVGEGVTSVPHHTTC